MTKEVRKWVRLTAAEYREIKDICQLENRTFANWLRIAVLQKLKKERN